MPRFTNQPEGEPMKRSDINDFIVANQQLSRAELAAQCGITENAIRKREQELIKKGLIKSRDPFVVPTPEPEISAEKTGIEARSDDRVIINWTAKTVITELGEFGSYTCNFSTHGAIQRAYVTGYEGKGETAAEVATRFDFLHAKAVHLYARLHGFTKSSLGQTDIEFELGLTPEDAAEENIQAHKRRAMKLTERRKWQEIQKDADRWNDFRINVYHPMRDWIEEYLPKYKPPVFKHKAARTNPFAAVVGVSDWHYLKHAYDHKGNAVYDREIARKSLQDANTSMVETMLKHGVPDRFFIPSGTDNLHFDYMTQTTTRGTPQAGQSDGDWATEMQNYVDIVIGMIEFYAQIAPVTVVSMPGNHDKHTSIMLRVLLATYYRNNKRITVVECEDPRTYLTYGSNAFMFTHGDDMTGKRLRDNAHKFFMAEAEDQGVKLSGCSNYAMFTGHVHTDQFADLGVVKHFIIPSLSGEDRWHKESGYVGNTKESSLYLFDQKKGRQAIIYS